MSKIQILTTEQVKTLYPQAYEILFNTITVKKDDYINTRRKDEPLHDYLIRLKTKCFCTNCRNTKLL